MKKHKAAPVYSWGQVVAGTACGLRVPGWSHPPLETRTKWQSVDCKNCLRVRTRKVKK